MPPQRHATRPCADTREHNAFNCSALAVLNVARDSMADIGFSPATRVFEAAGAGACLITDAWEGIELFLSRTRKCWSRATEQDVAEHVAALTPERARAIGEAGRARACWREHTYAQRAAQVDGCCARTLAASARGCRHERQLAHRRSRPQPVSSWGNGHATTYRALLKALAERGHEVLFLERDVPWYAAHRDLADPDFCRLQFYDDLDGR